jgi:hypothetical protein
MRPLIVIRHVPKIDFMRWHIYGFAFSLALTALTVGLFVTRAQLRHRFHRRHPDRGARHQRRCGSRGDAGEARCAAYR